MATEKKLTLFKYILLNPERFFNDWENHTKSIMYQIAVAFRDIQEKKTFTRNSDGPSIDHIFIQQNTEGSAPAVIVPSDIVMVGTFYDYFRVASIILQVLIQLVSAGRHSGVTARRLPCANPEIYKGDDIIVLDPLKVHFWFTSYFQWLLGLDHPYHVNYDWGVSHFLADNVIPVWEFVKALQNGYTYEEISPLVVPANIGIYMFYRVSSSCRNKESMTIQKAIDYLVPKTDLIEKERPAKRAREDEKPAEVDADLLPIENQEQKASKRLKEELPQAQTQDTKEPESV